MLTCIWERYLLKQFLKIFFLFLGCFYGLYVLIDYASHTSAFVQHHVRISGLEMARYYLFIFASRAEILIPIALLIATIKTLTSLNLYGELVGFLASGFKLKLLFRPFIFIGLISTVLIFLNEQFLLPTALTKLKRIEDSTKHQKSRNNLMMAARHLILEDGSLFLFQSYDTAKEQFFDAYWIRSVNDLYRMKYLSPYLSTPTGHFVDHIVRQPNGELALQESYSSLPFHGIRFNPEILQSTIIDADALSLEQLWIELPSQFEDLTEKQSKILASFYWKLIVPLLCLLAIIAPAPYCVRFSRQFPLFLIYAGGIFGLIAFYLFMDAALVVAKRQVLAPLWILVLPFCAVFGYFSYRFAKV